MFGKPGDKDSSQEHSKEHSEGKPQGGSEINRDGDQAKGALHQFQDEMHKEMSDQRPTELKKVQDDFNSDPEKVQTGKHLPVDQVSFDGKIYVTGAELNEKPKFDFHKPETWLPVGKVTPVYEPPGGKRPVIMQALNEHT